MKSLEVSRRRNCKQVIVSYQIYKYYVGFGGLKDRASAGQDVVLDDFVLYYMD